MMRTFNKLFVIALPRCATVSMSEALGMLGIRTAHLGHIYGEASGDHFDIERLSRIYEQIAAGDYDLDVLRECRGLADYPVCCMQVIERLDVQYPDSLFINVRRDQSLTRWLQSVERQFVGLELAKLGTNPTPAGRQFMEVMLKFREMTFGSSRFDATLYRTAYLQYQQQVERHFASRPEVLLEFHDLKELAKHGFSRLAEFLQLPAPAAEFPCSNVHSRLPQQTFMQALRDGRIQSQTGIQIPASDRSRA